MPIDKKWIVLIVPILLLGLFIFMFNSKEESSVVVTDIDPLNDDEFKREEIEDEPNLTLLVDLKGEVLNPGVYEMKDGDRVIDVIEIAGGFTNEADKMNVNLAQRLQDEMVIFVPKMNDEETPIELGSNNSEQKIRINYATKDELMTLPGIGEQKALSIIQYREENGFFRTKEDLLNISGIGEKTLERFKDLIAVP